MSHKKITSISYKGLCVILKSFRCACTLILINACTHTLALRALTRATSWISKGIFVCLVQMSHWAQGVQPRLFVCLDRPTSQASKPLKAPLGLALKKQKILSFLPGSAVAGSDARRLLLFTVKASPPLPTPSLSARRLQLGATTSPPSPTTPPPFSTTLQRPPTTGWLILIQENKHGWLHHHMLDHKMQPY